MTSTMTTTSPRGASLLHVRARTAALCAKLNFNKLLMSCLWAMTGAAILSRSIVVTSADVYNSVQGLLCIRDDFVRDVPSMRTEVGCACACSEEQRCQAFSMADGPCRLFVFDKCSKSVRDCGCSRRGPVFVKQQPALEAGSLCPSGYGDDLCGVKYRVLSTGNWSVQRQRCESESGLVIFADVTSSAEMTHIGRIYNTTAGGVSVWVGGFQPPGSPEPSGGWYWVSCNGTIDSSLWGSGEPNDGANEDATCIRTIMGDSRQSDSSRAGLCECLSPFE